MLVTPFGEVGIFVDGKSFPYIVKSIGPNNRCCPDVLGRYHASVDIILDGQEHTISCVIPSAGNIKRVFESGEDLECQSFYNGEYKLSIGLKCECGYFSDGKRQANRFDYDVEYLENGMAYRVFADTKTNKYVFGLAWIDNVIENDARDIQTWFGADITIK